MATNGKRDNDSSKVTTYLTGGKNLFGGREKPLCAHEVRCSCDDGKCQFRNDGQCVCVASRFLGLSWCPYGNVSMKKGYTSRAQKYYAFKRRYEDDPTYMALDTVGNMTYLRLVGDYVYVHLSEATLTASSKGESGRPIGHDGQILISNPVFGGTEGWFKRELFDVEVIIAICEFVPRSSWTYEKLDSYQGKTVPAFVEELRLHWPEMYEELETVRPDLCGKQVDYRGRKARTSTLRSGIVLKDSLGNRFILSDDRTELRCDGFKSALVSVGSTHAKGTATVVLPVSKKDTVKVEDNDWVIAGETVFV